MINKSLATIVKESAELEAKIFEADGLLTEEIQKALQVNAEELSEKADGYYMVIQRFKALETHYKEQADFMAKIAKSCAKVQETLKENIKFQMNFMQADEILGNDIRIVTTPVKPSVIVTDEDSIAREYFEEKTITVLNKEKLLQDLQIGPVIGAELKQGKAIRFYGNNKQKKIEGKNEQ